MYTKSNELIEPNSVKLFNHNGHIVIEVMVRDETSNHLFSIACGKDDYNGSIVRYQEDSEFPIMVERNVYFDESGKITVENEKGKEIKGLEHLERITALALIFHIEDYTACKINEAINFCCVLLKHEEKTKEEKEFEEGINKLFN